ncbi:MAG: 2Fe-2S iron-sulfur cluster binding domain-containing protein [Oleispira antarctica]|nr:2Fe-2S iron-sulfur cluster binding domain-containing protein [Oleispira antarctica]MBQ0791579.1 2Fe-2S iron-sulfur cluster binding domain-containing protein [Oleispira antarctica]
MPSNHSNSNDNTRSGKKNTILHAVNGYQNALDHQRELVKTGTDFNEENGLVARTIASLHPKRLKLIVSEVIEDTASTKTLRFKAEDNFLPPFQAGQYINLFVNIEGTETARPYAISSAPQERGFYDLTIKRVADGFVSHFLLNDVKVGDLFQSTGPMGTFYHNPLFHGDDLVFLAGGSGIAPARSMILNMIENIRALNTKTAPKMHLIYASSYEADVIYERELKQLEKAHEFLTITWLISRPTKNYKGRTGHVNAELLTALLGSDLDTLQAKMFYICGPTSFHDFCDEQLKQLKVKARRVRIECNGPPKHPEKLSGWPENLIATDKVKVTIHKADGSQGVFEARVDEPLLNSMERHGYSAENACRSGECSLCRVKVLKGSVFNPAEARLRSTDEAYGWCHSCVAFPTSDVELLV